MNHQPPYFEKYSGRQSRHECPACHDKHSFTYYLNGDTGQVIDKSVGRCNRQDKCGYHYPPKQYFEDNPDEFFDTIKKGASSDTKRIFASPRVREDESSMQEPGTIPEQYLTRSLGHGSNFVAFLRTILEPPTIERLADDYRLGCTKDGSVIYWQIDTESRVRTGKVMQYNPETGKRIKKESGAIDWVHAKLKRDNVLPDDFNLVQCLFGEHLLLKYPDKVVALVEAEKSALIGAGAMPEYLWLSTGGKQNFNAEKCRVLKGRSILVFPDLGAFDDWQGKASTIERQVGCKIEVVDLLERIASPEDRENGLDIADYLIRELRVSNPDPGILVAEKFLDKERPRIEF